MILDIETTKRSQQIWAKTTTRNKYPSIQRIDKQKRPKRVLVRKTGPNEKPTNPTQRNRAELKRQRLWWGWVECCPGCLGQNYYAKFANSLSHASPLQISSPLTFYLSVLAIIPSLSFPHCGSAPPLRFPVRPRTQQLLAGPTLPPRTYAHARTDVRIPPAVPTDGSDPRALRKR